MMIYTTEFIKNERRSLIDILLGRRPKSIVSVKSNLRMALLQNAVDNGCRDLMSLSINESPDVGDEDCVWAEVSVANA